ncbi:MAG TPA: hypothetical protein VG870_06675 [Chitinophagaceae bacterium]|nr:hypothetical protein [Chitinophagaceae bacterium]
MKYITLVCSVWLVLLSCSTVRITHTWKKEDLAAKKVSRILVLGILKDKDQSLQEKMENHMADDLRAAGFTVQTSMKEYGPKAFEGLGEAEVLGKLENSGFDAVITIVLLDKSRERYYVPSRIYYTPYGIYYHRFWGYYSTVYDRIYSPGYYQVNTRYFWESNCYDILSKDLLYSVQTESFDPASVDGLAHEYGKLIVKDLLSRQILVR